MHYYLVTKQQAPRSRIVCLVSQLIYIFSIYMCACLYENNWVPTFSLLPTTDSRTKGGTFFHSWSFDCAAPVALLETQSFYCVPERKWERERQRAINGYNVTLEFWLTAIVAELEENRTANRALPLPVPCKYSTWISIHCLSRREREWDQTSTIQTVTFFDAIEKSSILTEQLELLVMLWMAVGLVGQCSVLTFFTSVRVISERSQATVIYVMLLKAEFRIQNLFNDLSCRL